MCGIAGVFHRDGAPAAPVRVKAMTDVIAHRGPDGEGQFVDGVGRSRSPAPCRSSICRHSASQPMTTSDGRYTVAFNGEIFNFQELRSELAARGHRFVSRTDSEVLLHAFAEWGLGVLRRFNGMFAFAIWDRDERILTLARDRFGVKPLYWAEANSCFISARKSKRYLHMDR